MNRDIRVKNLCDVFDKVEEISLMRAGDLRVVMYLGRLEDNINSMKELGWEDEDQRALSEASLKKISGWLGMKNVDCRKAYGRLSRKGVVERLEHHYYKGRIFLGLTDSGRRVYRMLVDNTALVQ